MKYAIVYADGSIAWGHWFSSAGAAQKLLDRYRGWAWAEGCYVVGSSGEIKSTK